MEASDLTDGDFERLSWHDCHIWGLSIGAGDPDAGDWTSDLALDLDFIVEWICGVDETFQFRVAPATLTFHGVTDLRIGVSLGDGALQAAIHPISIDRIARERVEAAKSVSGPARTIGGGSSQTGQLAAKSSLARSASRSACAPNQS